MPANSPAIEDYLKTVYAHTEWQPDPITPSGLAGALGVAPSSVTEMVKKMAAQGLVQHVPYGAIRLTDAGRTRALAVVRRHRLIETWLVREMGYAWDEVHEEAEQLEHVVSDRLIDRMDEMLGRPEADPHGDPIPNAEGLVKAQEAESLLTCPLRTPVTVTRVIDQDKVFLRFIENHNLKPGEAIEVEARDAASRSSTSIDSPGLRLCCSMNRRNTLS